MGIVNTDSAALSRAKAEAAEALRRKHAVDASMSELNTLRNEVAELKQLVQQLVSAHQAKEGKN